MLPCSIIKGLKLVNYQNLCIVEMKQGVRKSQNAFMASCQGYAYDAEKQIHFRALMCPSKTDT